jgi:hypothetical protein
MKLTTGILAIAMMVGAAWAQSPGAVPAQTTKPTPGSPAPAVKPASIPGAKSASDLAAKSASTSGQHNQLQRVNVAESADAIQIEMTSSRAVTPRVSKLGSPARVLVELPETIVATSQNHIAVGSGGVKGLRIGMNGKNPPTTSVVVDLDNAIAYDLTPGPAEKLVLTLHTQGAAKSATAPAKASAAAQPVTTAKNAPPAAKPQPAAAKPAAAPVVAAKAVAPKPATTKEAAPKAAARKLAAKETKTAAPAKGTPAADPGKKAAASQPKPEEKKWAMTGKRDPFFSPVVQQAGGSGCSTGKKCLEIGAINLRGVVKSDNGFIAVVTNNLNKAYFLRENDPVFNGYVVKITGDSVVFQETVQDKLGKPFTREVVKRIFTPAV